MELLALTLGGALFTIVLEMIQDRLAAEPDRDPKEILAEMSKEAREHTAARGPVMDAALKKITDALAGKPEVQ